MARRSPSPSDPDGRSAARPAGPNLGEVLEDWLEVKNFDARENTAKSRRADLMRFVITLRAVLAHEPVESSQLVELCVDLSPTDVTTASVRRVLDSMLHSYRRSTVSRTLTSVRGATRWMYKTGLLPADPCDDDTLRLRPDPPGLDVHAFTSGDVEALLAAAASPPASVRSAWGERDVAIIAVAAHCGLRASEVAELRVENLRREGNVVIADVIHGTKGGKPRRVPVPHRTMEAVDVWLAARSVRLGAAPPDAPLFVSVAGKPLDRWFLDRMLRRVATAAGVAMPHDAAMHGLRHHYGVSLALRNVQPLIIAQLLGHADPRTSMMYTRMVSDQLADALDNAGWL